MIAAPAEEGFTIGDARPWEKSTADAALGGGGGRVAAWVGGGLMPAAEPLRPIEEEAECKFANVGLGDGCADGVVDDIEL